MPTVDGLPYPNSSATPDVPGDILALVNVLSRKNGAGISFAANSTALAQLVTDGLIKEGMFAFQLDVKELWYRGTSSWSRALEILNPHIELTSTVSAANSTNTTLGTFTVDGARSTDLTLAAQNGTGIFRLRDAGTYVISVSTLIPVATTGLSIVGITDGVITDRNPLATGSTYSIFTSTVRASSALTDITTYLNQTSGATRTVTGRISITKIG